MSNFNYAHLLLKVFTLFIIANALYSQPAFRAKERIAEFKKMKLLEILDLDEKTSEKFLAKYNSAEKTIREKQEKLDEAILDLEYLIRKNSTKEEISKQTQKVLDLQKELANTMFEQQKEIRSVLNEEQFARYVIFENRFRERLQKAIIERAKGKGWRNPEESPSPKREQRKPPRRDDFEDDSPR
ncbi:MAG: hypothetical protein ACK4SO_02070 [Candidatus Kapaibacteriota bacterium]